MGHPMNDRAYGMRAWPPAACAGRPRERRRALALLCPAPALLALPCLGSGSRSDDPVVVRSSTQYRLRAGAARPGAGRVAGAWGSGPVRLAADPSRVAPVGQEPEGRSRIGIECGVCGAPKRHALGAKSRVPRLAARTLPCPRACTPVPRRSCVSVTGEAGEGSRPHNVRRSAHSVRLERRSLDGTGGSAAAWRDGRPNELLGNRGPG